MWAVLGHGTFGTVRLYWAGDKLANMWLMNGVSGHDSALQGYTGPGITWANMWLMNGVSGHDSALYGYTGPGTTWVNEMDFVKNHAPGAGSIARPVDHVQREIEEREGRERERERERKRERDRKWVYINISYWELLESGCVSLKFRSSFSLHNIRSGANSTPKISSETAPRSHDNVILVNVHINIIT